MAYWHTGAPNRGNEFGWLGRVADDLAHQRRDNMLVNIGAHQSLAVNSKIHTPVVFDDPNKFQRDRWMSVPESSANNASGRGFDARSNRAYLHAIHDSAQASSSLIRSAWQAYAADADYGVAPSTCLKWRRVLMLDCRLSSIMYLSGTMLLIPVQQPALHRRLLSYVSDAVTAFVRSRYQRPC